jgi:hypothetical protein
MDRPLASEGDAQHDVATTAMAMLAFLGAGYTNRGDHPFAMIVSRATRRLKAAQRANGRFGDDARSHAWATLAMIEIYGMTESPIFKGSAVSALEALPFVLDVADDPLTLAAAACAWKSAALIEGDFLSRQRAAPWTTDTRAWDAAVAALARIDDGRDAVAAAASVAAQVLRADEPRVLASRAASLAPPDGRESPAYAWLGTLACFRTGGDAWKEWNRALTDTVAAARAGPPCCLGGRVEATALRTMSLEVYYRYDKVVGVR